MKCYPQGVKSNGRLRPGYRWAKGRKGCAIPSKAKRARARKGKSYKGKSNAKARRGKGRCLRWSKGRTRCLKRAKR